MTYPSYTLVDEGGPGSGHHGHKGRKGKRGGALPGVVTTGGLSTSSAIVDKAISLLKDNAVFKTFVKRAVNNPVGAPSKSMYTRMGYMAKRGYVKPVSQEVTTICNDLANTKKLPAIAPGMRFWDRMDAAIKDWQEELDSSSTTLAEHSTYAMNGKMTPEMVFFTAVNRVAAQKILGDSVSIYRGIYLSSEGGSKGYYDAMKKQFRSVGSNGVLSTHSSSSWSLNQAIAETFAYMGSPLDVPAIPGMVLRSRVSTKSDLISYGSWWGQGRNSAEEREVAVVGHQFNSQRVKLR